MQLRKDVTKLIKFPLTSKEAKGVMCELSLWHCIFLAVVLYCSDERSALETQHNRLFSPCFILWKITLVFIYLYVIIALI